MPTINLSHSSPWEIKAHRLLPDRITTKDGDRIGWLSWHYPTYTKGQERIPFPDIYYLDDEGNCVPTVLSIPEAIVVRGNKRFVEGTYIRGPVAVLVEVDHENCIAHFFQPKLQGENELQ